MLNNISSWIDSTIYHICFIFFSFNKTKKKYWKNVNINEI